MTDGIQGAFRALADPTRRDILLHLSAREMTIAEVADNFSMTRAAVKKHLTILEDGNLISVRTNGRERINRLEPLGLKEVSDWLSYFNRFWDDKLLELQRAVEDHERNKHG
ncbi:MAG: metalloregulator ArsR/SmtB family transcription factor [Pseudomonadota bacterium]